MKAGCAQRGAHYFFWLISQLSASLNNNLSVQLRMALALTYVKSISFPQAPIANRILEGRWQGTLETPRVSNILDTESKLPLLCFPKQENSPDKPSNH